MQITYQLTPEDLIAVQRDLIAPDPQAHSRFWRNLLVVPLIAALFALSVAQFELWSNWFVAPAVFSLFWVLFYTRSYRQDPDRRVRQWLAAGPNAMILRPRTVAINESEVAETLSGQTTQARWESVAKIVRNDQYMLIVLNPETAITVPKRVFVSTDAAEQFYTAATTYYQQARQTREVPA